MNLFLNEYIFAKELTNDDDQLGAKTLKRWEITDLNYPWKPGRKMKRSDSKPVQCPFVPVTQSMSVTDPEHMATHSGCREA